MGRVAELLKAYRGLMRARGMTHRELAEKLGVSSITIKRIFKPGSDTSLERLDNMCAAIGIGIDDLVQFAKSGRTELRLEKGDGDAER